MNCTSLNFKSLAQKFPKFLFLDKWMLEFSQKGHNTPLNPKPDIRNEIS